MNRRRFSQEDQFDFARLSGDSNPLHVDPMAARRLVFGRPVVHGIHLLSWALDRWLQSQSSAIELRSLRASFLKPVGVDEEVGYVLRSERDGRTEIEILSGPSVTTTLRFEWTPDEGRAQPLVSTDHPEKRAPRELSLESAKGASGELDLRLDLDAFGERFPNLARYVPAIQIAEIVATTRLVGTECPGLHSIYSELDLRFDQDPSGPPDSVLRYRVASVNSRFRLLVIELSAPRARGRIKAFVRPTSPVQRTFAELRAVVEPCEFEGQRAVVVGGSRGIGEVTAKLLAGGGADVEITYLRGEGDARRVVEDIVSGGGKADCFAFDVLNARAVAGRGPYTHLYYFATPFIFDGQKGRFSPDLFRKFNTYYVTGFLGTFEALRGNSPDLDRVLYPSSVAVDDVPVFMGEYAAAKAAGETACEFLTRTHPGVLMHVPRLPRIATDQTVSVLPVDNADPVPLMVEHLRRLRDLS